MELPPQKACQFVLPNCNKTGQSMQTLWSPHVLCCQYTFADLWQQLISSFEILLSISRETMATLRLSSSGVKASSAKHCCFSNPAPGLTTQTLWYFCIFLGISSSHVVVRLIENSKGIYLIFIYPFTWRKSSPLRTITWYVWTRFNKSLSQGGGSLHQFGRDLAFFHLSVSLYSTQFYFILLGTSQPLLLISVSNFLLALYLEHLLWYTATKATLLVLLTLPL